MGSHWNVGASLPTLCTELLPWRNQQRQTVLGAAHALNEALVDQIFEMVRTFLREEFLPSMVEELELDSVQCVVGALTLGRVLVELYEAIASRQLLKLGHLLSV